MYPVTDTSRPRTGPCRFSRPRSAPLIWAWLLLQTGCAANSPTEAANQKTTPYYQDAQLCRARHPARTIAPGADPAASIDAESYLRCMNQLGYQQDAKTDPLLVALRKCPQQGTAAVSASGAKTMRPPTQAAVRECLRLRGFPSAGQPPAPTASASGTAPASPASPPAPASSPPAASATPAKPPRQPGRERIQTIYIPPRTTQNP